MLAITSPSIWAFLNLSWIALVACGPSAGSSEHSAQLGPGLPYPQSSPLLGGGGSIRNYNFGAAAMRAHPGLADLQQNGLARAEVLRVFSLEKANEVMSEIANVAGRPTEMMKRFSTFADQSP